MQQCRRLRRWQRLTISKAGRNVSACMRLNSIVLLLLRRAGEMTAQPLCSRDWPPYSAAELSSCTPNCMLRVVLLTGQARFSVLSIMMLTTRATSARSTNTLRPCVCASLKGSASELPGIETQQQEECHAAQHATDGPAQASLPAAEQPVQASSTPLAETEADQNPSRPPAEAADDVIVSAAGTDPDSRAGAKRQEQDR